MAKSKNQAVWCVVGDVIDDASLAKVIERRRVSLRAFRPGFPLNAKLYMASLRGSWAPLVEFPKCSRSIEVICEMPDSGSWRKRFEWIPNISNWRIQLAHDQPLIQILRESGWAGFQLNADEFDAPEDLTGLKAVNQLLRAIRITLKTHSSWQGILRKKREAAIDAINDLTDFAGVRKDVIWAARFVDLATTLQSNSDNEAIRMYRDILRNKYGAIRLFYCGMCERLSEPEVRRFRHLFARVSRTMARLNQFETEGVERTSYLDG